MGRPIDTLALGRLERPPLYDRLSCGYLPWQAGLFSSLLSLEVLVDPSPRIVSPAGNGGNGPVPLSLPLPLHILAQSYGQHWRGQSAERKLLENFFGLKTTNLGITARPFGGPELLLTCQIRGWLCLTKTKVLWIAVPEVYRGLLLLPVG